MVNSANIVVLEDFNFDGNLDVLSVGKGFSISLGLGDGTFGSPQVTPFPSSGISSLAYDSFVRDLDSDGDLDLVVPLGTGPHPGHTLVYLGDGFGGLGLFQTIDTRLSLSSVMEDFDGDGIDDLVILSIGPTGAREIHLRKSDGAGGFSAPSLVPGVWEAAIAAVDLNNDGFMDLVSDVFGSNESVTILHGLGNGTFETPVSLALPEIPWGIGALYPPRLKFNDVTGDGIVDATITYNDTRLYRGLGGGAFVGGVPVNAFGSAIAVGPLLGNGKPQVVTSNLRDLRVLEFDGSIGFDELQRAPSGFQGDDIALGDLNHDGLLDVVSVGSGGVTVRLGQPVVERPLRAARTQGLQDLGNHPVAADLNLDGSPDLVMLRENELITLLGDGLGGFDQGMLSTGAELTDNGAVAIGQFLGDSYPDAVVAYNQTVQFSIGTGQGDFLPGPTLSQAFPGKANAIKVAQLDLDPDPEFVILSSQFSDEIQVKLLDSDGTGGFFGNGVLSAPGNLASDLAAEDLNGDGFTDLVVTSKLYFGDVEMHVFLSTGNSTFAAPVSYPLPGGDPSGLSLSDMNGDGFVDAVTRQSKPFASTGSPLLSISLGDGTGGFGPPVSQAVSLDGDLLVEDFNADGVLDVAARSGGVVETWQGVGDGTLAVGPTYPLGTNSQGMAAADVNKDGRMDIVSPLWISNFTTFFPDLSILDNFTNGWATTCGPAAVNSSGNFARISASGSNSVSANNLTLNVSGLPAGQFGIFIAARATMEPVPLGSGDGSLCLGGAFYRWTVDSNSIQLSDGAGEVDYTLDLTVTPPGTLLSPGETWFFQYWTRDNGGNSNTSDALMVDLGW